LADYVGYWHAGSKGDFACAAQPPMPGRVGG
jgi:hypothetical protein